MRKIQLLIFSCLLSWAVMAQDVHYSQFYLAPLDLNPALTGVMNCSQRVSGVYRNQWASVLRSNAFQTYSVAYDTRIPVGRNDFIGVGGSLWGDRAGSLNFHTNQLNASFSYSKKMGGYRKKANYLVMGADVGLGQRGINMLNARWGNQNNGGNFDGSIPSNETVFLDGRDNFLIPDVSAGLLWFQVFDDNNNFYIGGAYDHINRPNISFTDNKFVAMPSKFTFHAGGEFLINDRISLLPGAVALLQNPFMEINAGTSMRFLMGNSKRSSEALQFGTWARLGNRTGGILMDAFIVSTRFDYQNFSIGFSYDLNVSSLKAASRSNGGFEFALLYKICGAEKRSVYCPNF
jgi:type IX secretion system PorP/SprF family membrane protein